ncbi:hypothetical protein [Rubripirellula obstinata]|uniref:hypothetical protein n=1 Tax=Rubripirellula obstinata TaxID=406547 RepID=UPI0012FA2EAD|nr:hypothetical protein [Rubripirellula obstinata]
MIRQRMRIPIPVPKRMLLSLSGSAMNRPVIIFPESATGMLASFRCTANFLGLSD